MFEGKALKVLILYPGRPIFCEGFGGWLRAKPSRFDSIFVYGRGCLSFAVLFFLKLDSLGIYSYTCEEKNRLKECVEWDIFQG